VKNILIIGGAGYIGSHQTFEMCESEKYNIIVLDNLTTGFKDAVDSRALFIQGDIRDFELLKKILTENKIDGVIHFAALSLVGTSMTEPLEYYDNNVYGMMQLLKAMKASNVKQIVFSSTAATYGKQEKMPITEDDETKPINTYGETKLTMEKMMH
jgi:UDP-glucose 4-epimerase